MSIVVVLFWLNLRRGLGSAAVLEIKGELVDSVGIAESLESKMLRISQPAVARMEAEGGNLEIRTLARAAEVLDARLEIRLISVPRRSSARSARPYASGCVAPGFVREAARAYGVATGDRTAARKKPARTSSTKRKR